MWLFTTFGFFSIVQKQPGDLLTVRARVRADLERLREHLPSMSEIVEGAGTDYPYRTTVERERFAEALAALGRSIDYSNFKEAVADELGPAREALCHEVWSAMQGAEAAEERGRERSRPSGRPERIVSFGGVVVNEHDEVLLLEPRNHFGGVAWSFPKGRPEAGETAEETAAREVLEETNVTAEIVGKIPGAFTGAVGENVYFLMRAEGRPGSPGAEAQAVSWVPLDRAAEYLRRTPTLASRERDLRVLEVAREMIGMLRRR